MKRDVKGTRARPAGGWSEARSLDLTSKAADLPANASAIAAHNHNRRRQPFLRAQHRSRPLLLLPLLPHDCPLNWNINQLPTFHPQPILSDPTVVRQSFLASTRHRRRGKSPTFRGPDLTITTDAAAVTSAGDHKQCRILINLVRTCLSNVKMRAWWLCH